MTRSIATHSVRGRAACGLARAAPGGDRCDDDPAATYRHVDASRPAARRREDPGRLHELHLARRSMPTCSAAYRRKAQEHLTTLTRQTDPASAGGRARRVGNASDRDERCGDTKRPADHLEPGIVRARRPPRRSRSPLSDGEDEASRGLRCTTALPQRGATTTALPAIATARSGASASWRSTRGLAFASGRLRSRRRRARGHVTHRPPETAKSMTPGRHHRRRGTSAHPASAHGSRRDDRRENAAITARPRPTKNGSGVATARRSREEV